MRDYVLDPECTSLFFFFNDTATTEIYTLSLHDALPILVDVARRAGVSLKTVSRVVNNEPAVAQPLVDRETVLRLDRKSTRLNSSHQIISYAVFCLKKKNTQKYR